MYRGYSTDPSPLQPYCLTTPITNSNYPTQELMTVNNSSCPHTLPKTLDHYTTEEHTRMDLEVKAILEKENTLWREDPSEPELHFVFQTVVQGDVRLD